MSRQKVIIWVFIGLLTLSVVIFLKLVPTRKEKSSQGASTAQTPTSSPSEIQAIDSSRWGRDPFVLGTVGEDFSVDHRLTGIIYDEANPEESFAIVEGQLVRAGDSQADWRVLKIEKDRVILKVNGKEEELLLNQPE